MKLSCADFQFPNNLYLSVTSISYILCTVSNFLHHECRCSFLNLKLLVAAFLKKIIYIYVNKAIRYLRIYIYLSARKAQLKSRKTSRLRWNLNWVSIPKTSGFSRYVTKDNDGTSSNSHKNAIALVKMDHGNTSSCDWTLNVKAKMDETHFFIINHLLGGMCMVETVPETPRKHVDSRFGYNKNTCRCMVTR